MIVSLILLYLAKINILLAYTVAKSAVMGFVTVSAFSFSIYQRQALPTYVSPHELEIVRFLSVIAISKFPPTKVTFYYMTALLETSLHIKIYF